MIAKVVSQPFIEGKYEWECESPDKVTLWIETKYIDTDVAMQFVKKGYITIYLFGGITQVMFHAEFFPE